MSQAALAARLNISGPAVTKLERAEPTGGITLAKLAEVASALDCSLVYAFVPNTTIEATVQAEARRVATLALGYAGRTMALEAQGIDPDRQSEGIERFAAPRPSRGVDLGWKKRAQGELRTSGRWSRPSRPTTTRS